jgi:endo-1,4-beta-D-glucanase Y
LYNKWKTNFLVSAGSYGLAVKANADYPYVAEGQGYGMELTVLMAGADPSAQSSFDGILKYVLAHPSSINPDLHASEQNSSFVSVDGSDSATDGDLSIAYALLQADKQWGSAGTYNYKSLAITRINAIKASEMDPKTFLPTLGDWDTPGDSLYNSTRPSDLMIDHFRAFQAATNDPFWGSAVTAAQNLVTQEQNTYAPTTGLIADFVVHTNTTPQPAPANFLEGSTDGQYSYNSVRVPWHLGVDAVVYGDATSKAQTQKITAWFRSKTGDNPSKVVSGYKLDGTPVVSYLDPEFVATLGPAAMGDPANQAWLDKIWAYTVAQSQTSAANSYYSASLMLQSMIVMSGNYWAP